jgi:uncharacterized membrane protein
MALIWVGLGLVVLVMGLWFLMVWAISSKDGWRQ